MSNSPTKAIIAMGANLGEAAEIILDALRRLGRREGVRVLKVSMLRKTAPVNCPEGSPPFHNGCALIETTLSAKALLVVLLAQEAELGRERDGERNQPREIDLDLIFYSDTVIDEDELHVPHPRMHERRFVLEPLCDIAPEWQHPELGKSAAELLAGLDG